MTTAAKPIQSHWLFGPIYAARWTYIQVGMATFLINLFSLGTSIFVMAVYDRVVPNNAQSSLIALVIGMAVVLIFDFILKALRGYFIDIAGHQIDAQVGESIYKRLLDMRMANKKGSNGSFAGLLREFETLREFFASATMAALVDLPFVILFLIVIGLVGGAVVWVPVIAVPVVIIIGWLVQPALQRLSGQSMQQGFTKQGVLVETVSGLETIKTIGASAVLENRWRTAVSSHADVSRKMRGFSSIAVNAAGFAQQIAYVGTVFVGVLMIGKGHLTTGGLVASSMMVSRALSPLTQIAQLLSRIGQTQAAYNQLDAMMSQSGETSDSTSYMRRKNLSGAVEFRNVIFRYPGSTVRALDDVSFKINPGEKVAILGRIGSGKSTLARLIMGLYEPSEGAIMIDDTDARQLHPKDLRRNIGAVLQDVVLLSGPIRENITLRDPDASDDDVLRVSKLAGVHDFVGQIPGGYDIKLTDRGEGLSGGQRQSIAVARALLGAPPILLFDEPTAAMDSSTEAVLLDNLATETKDRTLLLITHRMTLLRLVERVIIIDRGKIVADGPRDVVLGAAGGAV